MTDVIDSTVIPGARIAGGVVAGDPHPATGMPSRSSRRAGWVGVDTVDDAVSAALSDKDSSSAFFLH